MARFAASIGDEGEFPSSNSSTEIPDSTSPPALEKPRMRSAASAEPSPVPWPPRMPAEGTRGGLEHSRRGAKKQAGRGSIEGAEFCDRIWPREARRRFGCTNRVRGSLEKRSVIDLGHIVTRASARPHIPVRASQPTATAHRVSAHCVWTCYYGPHTP